MDELRKIYSLTELGKSIRSVIERNYTSSYWIKAEIAKLNFYPRSGHCYPELVDKSGNVIQAQMRATIWAADFKLINKLFTEVAGEKLREGMSILFRGSVGYHPVYGLSLQIWEIEPTFTLGEMALQKSKNVEKLKQEGIFDSNKQMQMPLLPKRLAIISVETSKGYSDFLNILKEHASNYAWWHFLFPSVLQGEKAVEGILSQLRVIKKVQHRFDMVAIIRGGGGDIGLNCYDDYHLAREIATFPLPVITGIGHATNETIAEMVAWANKITPTDVAYFVVDKFRDFEKRVTNATRVLSSKAINLLAYNNQIMDHLESKLMKYPSHMFSLQKGKLDAVSSTLVSATRAMQQQHKDKLGEVGMKLTMLTPNMISLQRCEIDNKEVKLKSVIRQFLVQSQNAMDKLETKSRLLDPENVLKRGYSITRINGKSLRDASDVKPGDVLDTKLYHGALKSTVVED